MARRQHALDAFLRHQEPGEGTDDERLLYFGRIEFHKRTSGAIAGIVDNDIWGAERSFDVGEQLRDLLVLCRITRKGLAADFLRERREIVGAARRERHLHACFGKCSRH